MHHATAEHYSRIIQVHLEKDEFHIVHRIIDDLDSACRIEKSDDPSLSYLLRGTIEQQNGNFGRLTSKSERISAVLTILAEKSNVITVDDLKLMTRSQFMATPGLGLVRYNSFVETLADHGVIWPDDQD